MLQNIFKKHLNAQSTASVFQTYFMGNASPQWTASNYEQFATEGYVKNVVAYRCIAMIARSASFISLKCGVQNDDGNFVENTTHKLNSLFARPNENESFYDIMEKLYSYKLLWGNVFLRTFQGEDGNIDSIKCLRPDRVTILSDEYGDVAGYRYKYKKVKVDFPVRGDGFCEIIHIKSFNPLNDFYGLSAMEAAKYAIDQHNESAKYAKALLQNSARPSGALVVNATEHNNGGRLTDDQFHKLREQLTANHSGAVNNGKPLILEGGLDWKEMSMSPKDMDFIENKNSSAREIALAFGVPPQLLGIPGDNTYSNMSQARLALWEQTIIPLMQDVTKTLERAFGNILQEDELVIKFNKTQISDISQKDLS
ncbi:MAG: HK97 family phage portal protein [Candidatus Deianiraeaceae bacterium]|jgi:HK97 family phage portal protein